MERRIGTAEGVGGDSQTYAIIGAAMEVHRTLGCGFLEPVYQAALEVELGNRGVPFEREVQLPIFYKTTSLGLTYRPDFVCYGDVLVELKALERLTKREEAQTINYLVASRLSRGMLLNFGTSSLQFKRFVGPSARPISPPVQSGQSVDAVVTAR